MNRNSSSLQVLSSPHASDASTLPRPQHNLTRQSSRELLPTRRRVCVLFTELALAALSYVLAVVILRDREGPQWTRQVWAQALPVVLAFRFLGLVSVGLFKTSLRHSSIHDVLSIGKAVTVSSLLYFVFVRWLGFSDFHIPVALFVLDWALLQFLWGGLHFGARIYRSQRAIRRKRGKRVVIVGAGDAGLSLARELVSDPESGCWPVAILDDDPQRHGTIACGVRVEGGVQDLARVAARRGADEVLICIPSATRSEISRILALCCQSNMPVRTLPTLAELIDGKVSHRDLRNPRIEDLLQREEVRPDPKEIREIVGDKVVLVTGAGGSIGSELCRQVASAEPRVLLLLEKSENSLFYIHRDLRERFPALHIKPLLVDMVSRDPVNEIFRSERPEVVFHAAAHKHVGLLELHPAEAIRNNVLGTRNVALAALQNGVSCFVNISTDKAVNPKNYMGLSKRLTELCIQDLASRDSTRFMNVRFGNVAGSTGSVIRLFWEQIQKGEPLHVTDPRARRYFMSIPEAVYLILRAAGQGQGGETFVFEMGESINIYELARTLSLLAGRVPGKEVPIHFVGLRDGEKVDEQLWEDWERPTPTAHKGILVIADRNPLASGILAKLGQLEVYLASNDRNGLLGYVADLVPGFAAGRKHSLLRVDEEPKPVGSNSQEGSMKVPLSRPDIGEKEIQYVTQVLRTGDLSLGPRLREFEEKFAAYVGARYAVATNSGTSALHLCVRALGIGAQDEVITTSFSFVASANCMVYENALPVFVDIDPVTLNIDPKQIHQFLQQCCGLDSRRGVLIDKNTGRTVKAILPVHVFGLPCDMDPIMELAQQYGLRVIEDACEALGAEYRGRRVGTFGDAAAFAFYPNKQMTTAEGGMIVTDNEDVARLCRSMRNQGRDENSSWLQHVRLGYNYRLSDVHCALGLAQLERIEELLEAREQVAATYAGALSGSPLLTLPAEFNGFKRSWFVYVIQMNLAAPKAARDRLLLRLSEQGIRCQAYFPAIHRQPYLSGAAQIPLGPLSRTEAASDRCLALPFFSSASREQIDFVTETLLQTLDEEVSTAQEARAFAAATSGPA